MSYNRTRRGNGKNNNGSSLNSNNGNRNNNFENFNYEASNNINLRKAVGEMGLNNNNNNNGRERKIKFRNYANQTNFKFNANTGNFGKTQLVATRKNGRKGNIHRIAFNNNRASADNLNEPSLSQRVATAHREIAAGVNLPRKYTKNTANNYQNRKNLRRLVAMSMTSGTNRVKNNVMANYAKRTSANATKAHNIGKEDELNALNVIQNDD